MIDVEGMESEVAGVIFMNMSSNYRRLMREIYLLFPSLIFR